MFSALISLRISTCSFLLTTLMREIPYFLHALTSILPSEEAAAECTRGFNSSILRGHDECLNRQWIDQAACCFFHSQILRYWEDRESTDNCVFSTGSCISWTSSHEKHFLVLHSHSFWRCSSANHNSTAFESHNAWQCLACWIRSLGKSLV